MELHILYHGYKWTVRKPNAKRGIKVFKSLKDAETFARNMPEVNKIYIHRRDGTIARTITFFVTDGRGRTTTIDFNPEGP
jgi:hypothetical protein